MKRRTFLKTAGAVAAAGIEGIIASRRAPAWAQGTQLHVLRWNDFVPASDEVLRKQVVPEAEKALGVKVNLETVNANDLVPRITAAIQSGGGADIVMLVNINPQLYAGSLADVGDVADEIGKKQGGFYEVSQQVAQADGKWIGVPWAIVGNAIAYRKSWFEEAGAGSFPDTWEQYREVGKKLKANGHPLGQTLGHTFGDAPSFAYPYLWSWGGREVEKDGKKVVLDSKETVESAKFMTALWKDAFDEGGLAWDDTNNNRAFLSGEISATLNGASIYIESLRKADQYKTDKGQPLKEDIQHAPLPRGPAGRYHYHLPFTHVIPTYSKNQKPAKEFLRWVGSQPVYDKWFVSQKGFAVGSTKLWEGHEIWKQDARMIPFREAVKTGRVPGYAGPPNRKAAEVVSKYIITDIYAKAVQGTRPEDAVKAAADELRKIYG
jgi:multiple sugar transport system substrate-binding protein